MRFREKILYICTIYILYIIHMQTFKHKTFKNAFVWQKIQTQTKQKTNRFAKKIGTQGTELIFIHVQLFF